MNAHIQIHAYESVWAKLSVFILMTLSRVCQLSTPSHRWRMRQRNRLAGISWGLLDLPQICVCVCVIVEWDKEVSRLLHLKTRSPGCENQILVSLTVKCVTCCLHVEWIWLINQSVIWNDGVIGPLTQWYVALVMGNSKHKLRTTQQDKSSKTPHPHSILHTSTSYPKNYVSSLIIPLRRYNWYGPGLDLTVFFSFLYS